MSALTSSYKFLNCQICNCNMAILVCHTCRDSVRLQCQKCFDIAHNSDENSNHIREKLGLSEMKNLTYNKTREESDIKDAFKTSLRLNNEVSEYQYLKTKINSELTNNEEDISKCKTQLFGTRDEFTKETSTVK